MTDFSEGRILLDNESNLDTLAGNQYHLAPELYYAYKQGQYSDIKYKNIYKHHNTINLNNNN